MRNTSLLIFLLCICLCASMSITAQAAEPDLPLVTETVTVRLDFSRFNQSVLATSLSGRNYYDFSDVDGYTTIMEFQEFILKETFPELSEYGRSAEKVLAYTDQRGLLYDGVHDVVGSIADRIDNETVILYLWEGMQYMRWTQGGRAVTDTDAFVYTLLEENVHPDAATAVPFAEDAVVYKDVIGTDMLLNQVYLNKQSVFFSIHKGDIPLLFTQTIGDAASGVGLRLTLTTMDAETGLRLHYNEEALTALERLTFTEVCLVVGDKEQVYTMDALRKGE